MKCPICKKNNSRLHSIYGVLPCASCSKPFKSSKQSEFTTEEIKQDRKQYKDDILQPFRAGELSKEYVDKIGTKGLSVTPDEIKKARCVWSDLNYYD